MPYLFSTGDTENRPSLLKYLPVLQTLSWFWCIISVIIATIVINKSNIIYLHVRFPNLAELLQGRELILFIFVSLTFRVVAHKVFNKYFLDE